MTRIAVVGGGAWGTALADLLARKGEQVTLWAREPEVVDSVNQRHVNDMCLPGAPLAATLAATLDIRGRVRGGDVINVIALAAGILEGLGQGFNTRAALITRGLAEITRLGVALGAQPMTFAGLAGLGDLILTATGALSRNRGLGVALGQGQSVAQALARTQAVVEGVNTARTAVD